MGNLFDSRRGLKHAVSHESSCSELLLNAASAGLCEGVTVSGRDTGEFVPRPFGVGVCPQGDVFEPFAMSYWKQR